MKKQMAKRQKARGYEAAWEEAAQEIASRNFRGLKVTCPKCKQEGTVFSKWVSGSSIKPLFICHSDGNGFFKACEIEKEESSFIRSKIRITREDIIKLLRMGEIFVLFSGGKDSLCLLYYLNQLAKQIKREIVALHADTTAGFPEVEQYVKNACLKMKIKLITVSPNHDYFDLAKRWGIPGVKSRWCCETLKIAPIKRFLADIKGPKVIFDGIRAAESNIRATYVPVWFHPSFRCVCVSPIFNWSTGKIEAYIAKNKLPQNPASELNTSVECWCGAYKNKHDFEALLDIHPDIFNKLVQVEEAQRGKYTFIYEDGKKIPLKSLKNKR